ncbi:hypothetical protein EDB89DRAFT_614442 [Lactarius sanguifluus]|nr:hypothetical protein EDB89DRAFT_614442 [Lactarius sanguifluus]
MTLSVLLRTNSRTVFFFSSVLCGSLSVLQTPPPHPLTFSSNFLFELATRASAVRRRILSLHPHTHLCGTRSKLVLVYHAYIFSFFLVPLFFCLVRFFRAVIARRHFPDAIQLESS